MSPHRPEFYPLVLSGIGLLAQPGVHAAVFEDRSRHFLPCLDGGMDGCGICFIALGQTVHGAENIVVVLFDAVNFVFYAGTGDNDDHPGCRADHE